MPANDYYIAFEFRSNSVIPYPNVHISRVCHVESYDTSANHILPDTSPCTILYLDSTCRVVP